MVSGGIEDLFYVCVLVAYDLDVFENVLPADKSGLFSMLPVVNIIHSVLFNSMYKLLMGYLVRVQINLADISLFLTAHALAFIHIDIISIKYKLL